MANFEWQSNNKKEKNLGTGRKDAIMAKKMAFSFVLRDTQICLSIVYVQGLFWWNNITFKFLKLLRNCLFCHSVCTSEWRERACPGKKSLGESLSMAHTQKRRDISSGQAASGPFHCEAVIIVEWSIGPSNVDGDLYSFSAYCFTFDWWCEKCMKGDGREKGREEGSSPKIYGPIFGTGNCHQNMVRKLWKVIKSSIATTFSFSSSIRSVSSFALRPTAIYHTLAQASRE